jgi:quercetin dioxygenase-like cupin family protein
MHSGFEFLYLLEGDLELRHGEQGCILGAGDAVYFDSSTPHAYQCAGRKTASAIIVTMYRVPAGRTVPFRAVNAAKTVPDRPNPA